MYTKRIDIDGCTYLFNGELVRGSEHSEGGHWTSMGMSLKFNTILTHEQVQMVLDNLILFQPSNRAIVWKNEFVYSVQKYHTMKLDFIANDPGDPSVGLFPAQTNVTVLVYPSDHAAVDDEVVDFWRQCVADFLDATGCVQTVSEFNLEQEQIAKFESEQ